MWRLLQKTLSQKLTKGYTRVKKPFTLVRSRFSSAPPAGGAQDNHRSDATLAGEREQVGVHDRSGDDQNVEATMTKGDHMAAKHIPRAPRPAGMPAAAARLTGTGLPQ
jgi:hypothetical protein